MIDYVNIQINSEYTAGRLLAKFDFEATVKGGVVLSQKAEVKGIEVFVVGNQATIKGSLHKFWDGVNNASDFPLWAVSTAIGDLAELFEFDPKGAKIMGLEYGVNIKTDVPPKEIIEKVTVYDWREPFESMKGIVGVGYGVQANLSNYRVKIYDKGTQAGLPNTLRIESKTLRSIDLDGLASTLHDLTKVEVLEKFGKKLLSRFNDILLIEDWDNITGKELLFYHDAKNPKYWKNLYRQKRQRAINKYRELEQRFGRTYIKKELQNQVAQKWEELQNRDVFAWFIQGMVESGQCPLNWYDAPELQGEEETQKRDVFALLKVENVTLCLVTKEDISHQKKGSKFVSAKTILAKPKIAEKKGRKKYKPTVKESEEARAAHGFRNDYFNDGHNARRSIERRRQQRQKTGQVPLFSLEETISKSVLERVERYRGTPFDPFLRTVQI